MKALGPRWYVAHTYSGYEKKVKTSLEKIIENRGLHDLIFDVRVPEETIVEFDGEKEKTRENKLYPAYVFVKMIMQDLTWHVVRNISGVTGFVGPGSSPVPLTPEEVASVLRETPVSKPVAALSVGDKVEIFEGLFAGYSGTLSEISEDGSEASVIVSGIGRDMTIKLETKNVRRADA
ncbi:MAG: transcription termination/antitermination factor NusG [Clostridia bacterium]|nr:transcription termination/antitermination factor NusG [Clostridia bacterium]